MKKFLLFIIFLIFYYFPLNAETISVTESVVDLGKYEKISLPEGLEKSLKKGCSNSFECRADKATRLMVKIFKRNDEYNKRNPEEIIKALAYFEIFYLNKIKKDENKINSFLAEWTDDYMEKNQEIKKNAIRNLSKNQTGKFKQNILSKLKKNQLSKTLLKPAQDNNKKQIISLLKLNKSKNKMRNSIGLSKDISAEDAIKSYWALATYLEKGEVKKKKVHPDLIIRRQLLSKYQSKVKKVNSKIEKQKDEKLYKQIYDPKFTQEKFFKYLKSKSNKS